jgi:energy-coupling factor transporter ATP-binding protein EcfA2
MNVEDLRKKFDDYMASVTDEELIQEFKDMGYDVEIRKPDVIILRGASGCGKSSVARLFGGEVAICTADDYFYDETGKYNFNPDLLGKAHELCREKFLYALDNPELFDTIVVANTNTKNSEFQFYIDEAEKRGIMVFSLVVEKRHNGTNSHGVPESVIDRHVENIKNSLKLK